MTMMSDLAVWTKTGPLKHPATWRMRDVIAKFCLTLQRRQTRRQLARLDDLGLSDVALSRDQADAEIRRSFPLHGGDGQPWRSDWP